jgi:hypothetical protein
VLFSDHYLLGRQRALEVLLARWRREGDLGTNLLANPASFYKRIIGIETCTGLVAGPVGFEPLRVQAHS